MLREIFFSSCIAICVLYDTSAFWWIAGDCLGFRRGPGRTKRGTPYQFCSYLRYGEDRVIPYDEQVRTLCQSGFALWDICQSCERPGSLDKDIVNETPNPIREFCDAHPTICRIVIANGGTSAHIFRRHFADWFASGELVVADGDARSQQAFGSALRLSSQNKEKTGKTPSANVSGGAVAGGKRQIVLVCAIGVSNAAATYTYEEKRDYWEENVYRPGLALLSQASNTAH
jgi:hypoxanthine-DNA glycosylase